MSNMSTTFIQAGDFRVAKAAAEALRDRRLSASAAPRHSARRAYLKALRQAELEAWDAQGSRIESGADLLRRSRIELVSQRRTEGRLLAVLGGIVLAALLIAVWEPVRLAHGWTNFNHFVRQLLG